MIILSQEKIKYVIMKKNLAQNIKKKIDDKASDKSRYTDYRQSLYCCCRTWVLLGTGALHYSKDFIL